jgi:hypothetical protein
MALLLVGRVPDTSNRRIGWLATIHPYYYGTGESKEEGKCIENPGATSPGTLAGNAASLWPLSWQHPEEPEPFIWNGGLSILLSRSIV